MEINSRAARGRSVWSGIGEGGLVMVVVVWCWDVGVFRCLWLWDDDGGFVEVGVGISFDSVVLFVAVLVVVVV